MRLKLKDIGYPWMIIVRGTERVGRTCKGANGKYECHMAGKLVYAGGRSHEEAFREGGARYLGHGSADALAKANAAVKEQNAAARADMNRMVRDFQQATPEQRVAAFDQIMGRILRCDQ